VTDGQTSKSHMSDGSTIPTTTKECSICRIPLCKKCVWNEYDVHRRCCVSCDSITIRWLLVRICVYKDTYIIHLSRYHTYTGIYKHITLTYYCIYTYPPRLYIYHSQSIIDTNVSKLAPKTSFYTCLEPYLHKFISSDHISFIFYLIGSVGVLF